MKVTDRVDVIHLLYLSISSIGIISFILRSKEYLFL
nr:MAG TPA: hypothetical protein [Caudoviricetes sp.]